MKVKVRQGTSARRRRWLLAPAAGAAAALAFAATALGGTPNAWTRAHDMSTPRFGAAAAVLPSGKVLVAGGEDSLAHPTASAEIYDPAQDTWTPAHDMNAALDSGEAAVLADGSVLVVGAGASDNPVSEVYDPVHDSWSTTVTGMQDPHRLGAIVPLSGGKLMVVGGIGAAAGSSDKVDIFDPVAKSFSAGTPLPEPRLAPAVAALPDGKVLVAGGIDPPSTLLDTALVYDPDRDSWAATANGLSVARVQAVAAPLPEGKVLIAGGADSSIAASAAADVYDPATNTFSPTASMTTKRASPGVATLADGRVIVAGGVATKDAGDLYVNASAEAYDPATATWSPAGRMSEPRLQFPLVRLPDDELLAVGGSAKAQTATSLAPVPLVSADRYTAAAAPSAPEAVSAAAGNGSALVTWAPPASDGGLPILRYTVTASPGGATATTTDARTAATVSGLTNGVAYTFTVKAVNARGAGAASAPSNAVTPRAPVTSRPTPTPTPTPAPMPTPGQPTPPTTKPDTKAPRVKIHGLHSRMTPKGFLHGVRLRLTPSEPSRLDVSLVGYARRATIARTYDLTLARRHTGTSRHTRKLTLKPRKRLLGHARRFRVQLRVVATDRAGNRRTVTRTIRVAPKNRHRSKHHRG